MKFYSAFDRLDSGAGIRRPTWGDGVYWFKREDSKVVAMPHGSVIDTIPCDAMLLDDWEVVDLPFAGYNNEKVMYVLRTTSVSGDTVTLHEEEEGAVANLAHYCVSRWGHYHDAFIPDEVREIRRVTIRRYFAASKAKDVYPEKFVLVQVVIPQGDAWGVDDVEDMVQRSPARTRALDLSFKEGDGT